jgi:hypothetical protein
MPSRKFYQEREQIALRLDEEIRASLSKDQIPSINEALEEVYGAFALGKHPETREMRFFLEDVQAFSPGLINSVRRLVVNEFQKWTVVPQFVEREFTVSSGGVDFGDTVVREPINSVTPSFRNWMTATLQYDNQRNGPLRRQLRWIRRRVPEALCRLAEERFVPLGVFDRHRPPYTGRPIWVLLRPIDWAVYLTPPEAPAASYPVDADGVLHPQNSERFNILTGETPAAWLKVFVPDLTPGKSVEVVNSDKEQIGRIDLPDPIADHDLCEG